MILKEIMHHIKSLLRKKKEVVINRDDVERLNVCGGVLTINKTHTQKVKEARNG